MPPSCIAYGTLYVEELGMTKYNLQSQKRYKGLLRQSVYSLRILRSMFVGLKAMQQNKAMVAEYTPLSDDVIQLQKQIEAICEKMKTLFIYHSVHMYPIHLNILGSFLYTRYYWIRAELMKLGAHVKFDARYLDPVNGLQYKFQSLVNYIEILSTIPNIKQHLEEIMIILDYAMDPKPIEKTDIFNLWSIENNGEPIPFQDGENDGRATPLHEGLTIN